MGPLEKAIHGKIIAALHPSRFELENESAKHGFSRGDEGHFKVLIVANAFDGLSRIERHQKIFGLVRAELDSGVHALAIRALTPNEETDTLKKFESPECQHGRK
jgi:BolA protein